MHTEYDLLIVGGGLAGNCLALALQETGLRIAVIEAIDREQRFSSPAGDRALALASGSVRILEQVQVWQAASEYATRIKQIHISDQGHFGKTRLSAERENVAALGYVIEARHLEEVVADRVDQSGVVQICPARLNGLMADEQQIHVSLKQDNKSLNLTSKLLVGADGGNSSVRKLLEIPQEVTEYGQTALVTSIATAKHHNETAFERFTASGPLALLPQGENCSVVWTRLTAQAENLIQCNEQEFIAQLQDCFGYKLGEFSLVAPRRAFPLKLIRAERMLAERVVLIGNAVHQLHPVAGQGLNLGLRDVIQLADILRQQLQQDKDIGSEDLLSAFAKQRQNDHDKLINFTDGVVRIFSNDWLPVTLARNAGLTLLDHIPGAKSILARHAMGLHTPMPNISERNSLDSKNTR